MTRIEGGSNIVLPNNAYRNRWGLNTGRRNPLMDLFNAVGGVGGVGLRVKNEMALREMRGEVDARNEALRSRLTGEAHLDTAKAWNQQHVEDIRGRHQRGEITDEQAQDLMAHSAGYGGRGVISAAPTRSIQEHRADAGAWEQKLKDTHAAHAKNIEDMKATHAKNLESATDAVAKKLTKVHEARMSKVQKEYDAKVSDLQSQIDALKGGGKKGGKRNPNESREEEEK